ncbi:MAG TPA: hypothetical protein VIV35_11630 [Chitinophagaceae bacterium]
MKSIILSLLVAVALTSCTNYGKKVKTGEVEVYYKDGVSEEQAKKISSLFNAALQSTNPGSTSRKSFQVTKPSDSVLLKMVVDKSKLDKVGDETFYAISGLVSDSVFNGGPVNLILTDDHFKTIRTLAFKKAVKEENVVDNNNTTVITKEDFDHDSAGGVDFYWKGISDEESKTIADYIVKNGSFAGGTAEIYMTKQGDRFILRFPMIESARTDPAYLAEVEKVTKEIKDNVFANVPFSFIVTDERMNTVKSWDY